MNSITLSAAPGESLIVGLVGGVLQETLSDCLMNWRTLDCYFDYFVGTLIWILFAVLTAFVWMTQTALTITVCIAVHNTVYANKLHVCRHSCTLHELQEVRQS